MATSRRAGTNEQIATYGTGKTYTEGNLATWEQATDTDHVTDTETDVLEVYAEGGGGGLWDDTDALDGSINDADYFRIIRAASGEGHSGIPLDDGTVVGFRQTADSFLLRIDEDYSQFQDLVGKVSIDSTNSRLVFGGTGNSTYYIGLLLFDSANAGTGKVDGFSLWTGSIAYIINCLVHNIEQYGIKNSVTNLYVYNTTLDGNSTDLYSDADIINSKNVIYATTGGAGTFNFTTCYDTDGGAPTYVDSVNDDFHLQAGDATCKDQGTDLSADGTFAFDDDINDGVMGAGKAGETRTGTWDIGFDEYVAAAAGNPWYYYAQQ